MNQNRIGKCVKFVNVIILSGLLAACAGSAKPTGKAEERAAEPAEAAASEDAGRIERTPTGDLAREVFTEESEVEKVGVTLRLESVTRTGAELVFLRCCDEGAEGKPTDPEPVEVVYGEAYEIEKQNDGRWEAVPTIIEDYGFTDIAYVIEAHGESRQEVDWSWLYGELSPGTYRIKKTIIGDGESYDLSAQFLIAGA